MTDGIQAKVGTVTFQPRQESPHEPDIEVPASVQNQEVGTELEMDIEEGDEEEGGDEDDGQDGEPMAVEGDYGMNLDFDDPDVDF